MLQIEFELNKSASDNFFVFYLENFVELLHWLLRLIIPEFGYLLLMTFFVDLNSFWPLNFQFF